MGETDAKVSNGGADDTSCGISALSCSYAELPQVRNSCECTWPKRRALTTPVCSETISQKLRENSGFQSSFLV
eukprot:scaffold78940_cov33-Tisochrysis_lutea.AAC.3